MVSAKTLIPHTVAYHLKHDRDYECMNWLDGWKNGKGSVTDEAA